MLIDVKKHFEFSSYLAGVSASNSYVPHRSIAGRLISVCALLVVPCFAAKVQSWVGKNADFSRYRTYEWLPVRVLTKTGVVENDETASPLIKAAVNRQLALQGLKEVEKGGDLQVSAGALAESIPQLEALIVPMGAYGLDYATPVATVGGYNREGTLVVNLLIAGTKNFAWLGIAKETVDRKPGSGLKKIDKAAAAMFKKYPKHPQAK